MNHISLGIIPNYTYNTYVDSNFRLLIQSFKPNRSHMRALPHRSVQQAALQARAKHIAFSKHTHADSM